VPARGHSANTRPPRWFQAHLPWPWGFSDPLLWAASVFVHLFVCFIAYLSPPNNEDSYPDNDGTLTEHMPLFSGEGTPAVRMHSLLLDGLLSGERSRAGSSLSQCLLGGVNTQALDR
jgi:hypothetical protein